MKLERGMKLEKLVEQLERGMKLEKLVEQLQERGMELEEERLEISACGARGRGTGPEIALQPQKIAPQQFLVGLGMPIVEFVFL